MKVSKRKIDDTKVKIEAVATPEEVENAFQMAELAFARQMSLAPVPGKPLAQAAEEQLGIKDLDKVVRTQVLDFLMPFALEKKKLVVAFPPKVLAPGFPARGKELTFSAEVTLKPEYELTSYEPVKVRLAPFVLPESSIDEQIAQLAERYASFEKDEPHEVRSGDDVLLKIEANVNGKVLAGLSTDGRTYCVGKGFMPTGFDEEIVGMDVGETKSFTFEGPGVDTKGKPKVDMVDCTVTVLEMQKRVLPEIDDAFVKENMSVFESCEGLRTAIEDSLKKNLRPEYDNYCYRVVASELGKRFEGRIVDEVYEHTKQTMLQTARNEAVQSGMTFTDFLEQNGGEQQFNALLTRQIRQTLVQSYSLDAVFRHAKLSINKEDLIEAARRINPQQPEAVLNQMEKSGRIFALRELTERMKANKWLLENAEITYTEIPSELPTEK